VADEELVILPQDVPDGHVGGVNSPEGSNFLKGTLIEVRIVSLVVRSGQVQRESSLLVHHMISIDGVIVVANL